jgi:hypothetical protein
MDMEKPYLASNLESPIQLRWAMLRSCYLGLWRKQPSHLAGGRVQGACVGRPLTLFITHSGGPQCPPEANRKVPCLPRRGTRPVWLQTQLRGKACGVEGGRRESEKTPRQAAFIQNAFPNVSLWPVEALLLTALFIHDRQLINSQTS